MPQDSLFQSANKITLVVHANHRKTRACGQQKEGSNDQRKSDHPEIAVLSFWDLHPERYTFFFLF